MTESAPSLLVEVGEDLLPLVQHLRYRVYVEEMGFALTGADASTRRLHDRLDGVGTTLALFIGQTLAASVRLTRPTRTMAADVFAEYDLEQHFPGTLAQTVVITRLVANPDLRGTQALSGIVGGVISQVQAWRTRWLVILAEPHMTEFYRSMGFDMVETGLDIPPYGVLNLLRFDMEDPRHSQGETLAGWVFKQAFRPG